MTTASETEMMVKQATTPSTTPSDVKDSAATSVDANKEHDNSSTQTSDEHDYSSEDEQKFADKSNDKIYEDLKIKFFDCLGSDKGRIKKKDHKWGSGASWSGDNAQLLWYKKTMENWISLAWQYVSVTSSLQPSHSLILPHMTPMSTLFLQPKLRTKKNTTEPT